MAEERQVLNKPVDWDELYPGRFIKAGDFKGKKPTLRIKDVDLEKLVGDKGPQVKGVITFDRTDKQWALNKTNGICLRGMFGRSVQEWIGKRVTLFAAMHDGEPCIRVWGSPDIDRDSVVTVALPRKRPFDMIMHKMLAAAAPSTQPSADREPGQDDGDGGEA